MTHQPEHFAANGACQCQCSACRGPVPGSERGCACPDCTHQRDMPLLERVRAVNAEVAACRNPKPCVHCQLRAEEACEAFAQFTSTGG